MVVVYASALHQKNFIKIGHRTWKIHSFYQTSPIFRVLASMVKWIA
jgi:DNA-directed RNA polymerase delta subunit